MDNKNKENFLLCFFLFLLISCPVVSSNTNTILDLQYDNIINYSTKDYLGGLHIWCVTKGKDKDMFFATSQGLSTFDGYTWRNFRHPNDAILRYLYYDKENNLLYCALDNEFGYWTKNLLGQWTYTLLYKNANPLFSEIFWTIESLKNKLYFQSQNRIYSFDKNRQEQKEILTANKIGHLLKFQNELYVQIDGQVYRCVNDKFEPTGLFLKSNIIHFASLNNKTYVITEDDGIIEIANFRVKDKEFPINRILLKAQVFSANQFSPNEIVIGSVLDGAFVVDEQLQIKKHFNFDYGLKHTTVLSIGTDDQSTLWLGLDGGLARIRHKTNEIALTTNRMEIGTMYDAKWFNNQLYIATSKGLFKYDRKNNFSFIEGSQGQIWNLVIINEDVLVVCHAKGLFQLDVENDSLQKIAEDRLWRVIAFDNNPNLFLGLNVDQYFSVYEHNENGFALKYTLQDISVGSTDVFIDRYGLIWTQNRLKQPIKIQLENQKATAVKTYSVALDSLHIAKIDGDVIFYNPTQAYIYNIAIDSIVVSDHHSSLIKEMKFFPNQIEQLSKNMFFYASQDQIAYLKRKEGRFYNIGEVFQSINKNEISSLAHKIIPINDSAIATQVEDGLALFFVQDQENKQGEGTLELSQLEVYQNNESILLPIQEDITHSLSSNYEYIRLYFKNFYPNSMIEYRIGENGKWISERPIPYIDIPKLSSGEHQLFFRNVSINNLDSNPTSYLRIKVAYPWYCNSFIYLIALFIIVIVIQIIRYRIKKSLQKEYKSITEKQIKILEKERTDLELKVLNTRLEEEQKTKASLTLKSLKYNMIFNEIKLQTQLSKEQKTDTSFLLQCLQNIAKSIDAYIGKEDSNQIFETHFNTIQDGFYDRLKAKHPDLTRNDMRLCAYIQLNLSTKEIAAYLNIATTSVEVARYRLRKKLNLDADTNLQEYIGEI